MPRRLILSATERDTLLALPESQDDLIRYYRGRFRLRAK